MVNKKILLSVTVIAILTLSAGVAWAGEETRTDISSSVADDRSYPDGSRRPVAIEGEASIEDISVRTPLAPGYCSSNGGNTSFEYISGVNYTRYPTGTMVITVEIFIANPTGCTYGSPCPEYDNSPEYVNAWVDWDGDNLFENHERVIDVNLTGYHDLNYYGTMTASTIVTVPPGAANTTWVRVNLGWKHDPNDPCELSWTWGDVFDEQVSTETDLPQIEDIIVTGPPGNETSPMTTFPVTLEAVTSSPTGFAITSISWSGDGIPAGATGSPYTYTPAAGTHGNKNIQCTIAYEKTETGETGLDTMTKGYKLFFEKWGDEDGDSEPNWFEHWATDGAVPRLGEAYYDPTMGGYGCFGCTGTRVEISPSAAGQHYSSPIVLNTYFGTERFGGPSVKGIDCAAEVVAHEFYHKWVWQNWQAGGTWVGKTDSDEGTPTSDYDDDLPDDYENTVSHTWNNDTDTYDLEHKKYYVYKYYGDQEYMAMKTGSATTGDPGRDWANPGKQTTPAYDISLALPVSVRSSGPVQANFTGTNSDEGIDTDGDGLYNHLRISSEVEATSGGVFNIVAILMDSAGDDVTFINRMIVLDPGIQTITLDFDGVSIWRHGVDGAFNVSLLLSNEYGDKLDHQYHITKTYDSKDFECQSAEFAGKFYEEVVDTDYDKLYNHLIVYAGVYVRTPGTYTVEGWLHDAIADEIVMAGKTIELDEGFQYVPLQFDGSAIRQHRVDGPYTVMELELSDEDRNRVDFIDKAYTTDDYPYTRFQRRGAELADSYESWGKDPNKNKFYDYLAIAVGLNIVKPGRYAVIGNLYDKNGNKIGQASAEKSFEERGHASVELDFSGKDIFKNKENGPYNLKQVILIGENGIVDQQQDAHKTNKYSYKRFQPLVLLTDYYTDHGEDLDNDGLYDSLIVCAEVLASDPGECVMSARLVDQNGKEILWADKSFHVDQNEPQTICLSFDGRYIYASMKDGPYYVSDVYVYHTGDAYVPDYASMAHRTEAYRYLKFEKSGIITGRVTKTNGDPVPNALVIIDGVDHDYTDGDGRYTLTILQDGTYMVTVNPAAGAGVTGDSAQISVKARETVTHDFVLSPRIELLKWAQPPDMKYGVNIQSTEVEPVVADDWQCQNPRPVADLHFWGSYIGWEANNPEPAIAPPGVDLFIIRIYEDVPADVDPDIPYSHPGKLLYAKKVSAFEERYAGTISHPDEDETYEHKFHYSMDLPELFEQEEGTIYWISIAAVMPDDEYKYPWGWETSTDHWNDNACRHWDYNNYWEEITPTMLPSWYQERYKTVDMAFELTVKPEIELDWGDAPDGVTAPGYPTLAISNGARHVIVPGFYLGPTVRVSQESSPGAGDFDANILGYVSSYATNLSTAGYYQYGTPYGASFNGPAPALTSNRSHLFLADTTDGLSLFVVHDKPEDGSGGTTRMHWTLTGDTAGVLAEDDPWETVTVSGGGTIFESSHGWAPCCTDGMAFGSLDGAWTVTGNFTNSIADTGMNEWHVYSSDNSSISLVLETGRRVRLDKHRPIDPEPDGQPDPNALGDDNDGNDDEDGVVFNTPLVPGQPATVTVTASAQGLLQGWIDFNADRDWSDPGEQIFVDQALAPGPNILNMSVPATATPGRTFARFRFSTAKRLSFNGPAPDGEVEDYRVAIECKPSIDVEKKVMDPETGEWMDAITANVGNTVRFNFTIHNDGTCCDLTEIMVTDMLSESLMYADNATVEPAFLGTHTVVWKFSERTLEPCQTITIEFDAEVVECGIDENIVKATAVCADTGVVVTDEDTATVMAGKPELEWTWNSTTVEPNYNQVMMAPVVADLNDDGIPDIIFSTFNRSWLAGGILRAISGDGGSELFSVTNPAYRVQAGAEPAVADIDNDGRPEIMVSKNTSEIICFEDDGSYKWTSATKVGRLAVAVADLDQDGTPEIIAGRTVFNNDGTVRWTGTAGRSYASLVADLDLDGKPEVVTGSAAYRYNGSIYWTSSPGGMPAIGNFDSDPYPEIVVVGGDNVSLKEHDGTLKWGPVPMPDGGGNGPPVVADIDGDGEPEIGVGGRLHYVVFETNGSIKWMADIVDTSSRAAGSSAFDFDQDGSCEIVYSDHHFHRIFKGSDGTVLFKTPGPSGTLIEQPVIVDVDNDGHVEIVFAVNNYAFSGNTGIEVYGNDNCWQTARCIWNQHTYHITNINDDATVPQFETNNWNVFNNCRAQSPHSCGEVDVTTVNVTPPSQDVYPGPFTVNVTVDPAEPIAGVQFNLSFNTSLMSADSVTERDLLNQDGASTYFSPGTIDNTAGTINSVAGVITSPGATVSSPGVFATIRMTAKSIEGTSPLDLSNVIVGDINGNPVTIMVNDGTVTITTCIGDVNGDGTVDVLDMILVGQQWGKTGTPGWIPEDVNNDGAVNVLDMIVIGQHWGSCP